jgi:ABC-type sugar transport system ATPase subunit
LRATRQSRKRLFRGKKGLPLVQAQIVIGQVFRTTSGMSARVELRNVSKKYDGGAVALSQFDLWVNDGELVVVVGPSGCGKTTLLRLIAGLERPTSGEITIGGRSADGLAPRERNVAMVFQSGALYPHLSVRRNLAFGLRGLPSKEIEEQVHSAARMLGIEGLLERRPADLSGGERQRVALGRAMVRRPSVFLLDEPLASLDAPLRRELRREIQRLHRASGAAMIYVTHDQAEARRLGDRVVVMNAGRAAQVGTPEEVFERPASPWVAAFLDDEFGEPAGVAVEPCAGQA